MSYAHTHRERNALHSTKRREISWHWKISGMQCVSMLWKNFYQFEQCFSLHYSCGCFSSLSLSFHSVFTLSGVVSIFHLPLNIMKHNRQKWNERAFVCVREDGICVLTKYTLSQAHTRRWFGSLGNTFAARECFAKWTSAWRDDDAQKTMLRNATMEEQEPEPARVREREKGNTGVPLLLETSVCFFLSSRTAFMEYFRLFGKSYTHKEQCWWRWSPSLSSSFLPLYGIFSIALSLRYFERIIVDFWGGLVLLCKFIAFT